MTQALVFLHLLGLMLGAAGGFASNLIMVRARAEPPEQARPMRALGPMLANMSGAGLVLLWLTGLALLWREWDGPADMPIWFWVKMAFVVALTLVLALIHHAYADIRRGNAAASARLPLLGPLAGFSTLLAVLFAVIAFTG